MSGSGDHAAFSRPHRDDIVVVHKIHRDLHLNEPSCPHIQTDRLALLDNAFKQIEVVLAHIDRNLADRTQQLGDSRAVIVMAVRKENLFDVEVKENFRQFE